MPLRDDSLMNATPFGETWMLLRFCFKTFRGTYSCEHPNGKRTILFQSNDSAKTGGKTVIVSNHYGRIKALKVKNDNGIGVKVGLWFHHQRDVLRCFHRRSFSWSGRKGDQGSPSLHTAASWIPL